MGAAASPLVLPAPLAGSCCARSRVCVCADVVVVVEAGGPSVIRLHEASCAEATAV